MNALFDWIHRYGTRALAVAAGTITTLVSTDIIPPAHVKYYLAALAILTYWRGQSTSNAYNAATAAPTPEKKV